MSSLTTTTIKYMHKLIGFIAVFSVLSLLVALTSISAQGIDFENGKWEEVKQKAMENDRIIFVDAYAAWCGPCKHMSKHVFTDEEVAQFYNGHFVNYKLDMEKGEGIAFAKHYNVRAYPTLLFINSNGDLLHQALGALNTEDFIELGKNALNPSTQIAVLRYQYEKGNRDPEFLRTYLLQAVKAGNTPSEIAESYFEALEEEDFVNEKNFEIIRMLRPSMDHQLFELVLQNKEEFARVVGEDEVEAFIAETCKWDLMRTAYKGSEEEFNHKLLIIDHLELDNDEEIIAYGELYKTQRSNDQEKYLDALQEYYKYADDEWNTLNTLAWEIYENGQYSDQKLLKFALKMAKRSIDLDKNYYNTDTYAALLYKLGDYKDSREWAVTAISLAKQEGIEYSETKLLLKKLEAAEK